MKWRIDADVLKRAEIVTDERNGEVWFTIPGFDHEVRAYVHEGDVDLAPERSHFHRVLLDRLRAHT